MIFSHRRYVLQQPAAKGHAAGDGGGPETAHARTAAAAKARPDRESLLAGWPARTVWALGWAATVIVAAADAALGEHAILIGLLVIGPCCAALTGRWVPTGLIGLWVIGLAFTLCLPDGIWGDADCYAWLALVAVVALACTGAAAFIQDRGLVRLR